jgi:hypothetical protein
MEQTAKSNAPEATIRRLLTEETQVQTQDSLYGIYVGGGNGIGFPRALPIYSANEHSTTATFATVKQWTETTRWRRLICSNTKEIRGT